MIRRSIVRNAVFSVIAWASTAALGQCQATLGPPVVPTSQPRTSPKTTLPAPVEMPATLPAILDDATPCCPSFMGLGKGSPGFLTGNQNFPNFIGFLSNPIQSIDPRATTELWPMFGSASASGNSNFLPSASMQVYGAGLNVALSDRFAFGLNQGGYAVVNVDRSRQNLLAKLGLPVPDRDLGGVREGWLNLGGWAQYTLVADVPKQFLLTAGLRWEVPSGATQVFQGGANPTYLAPYLTVGKEFGCFHFLATTGYEFPVGPGTATTETFYLNVHLDRKIGWLYPLVELNGAYQAKTVDVNLPLRHDVLNLGTFSTTGNSLTLAVGANAVLVPGKLEFGAVYTRPIADQGNFDFNGLLVKMVYRY